MTSDDLTSDLVWEKRWVGRPPNTHFSAGGSSPLLRADDTNMLETHATMGGLVEADGDESELQAVAAGIALGVLVAIGAVKAARGAKAWWEERRATKNAQAQAAECADEATTSEVTALAVGAFASEVEEALEAQRTKMSSAEAHRRILEMLLAAALIADNVRALSNAQFDDGTSMRLQSALATLAAPDVTDTLNRILEADSGLLREQASADLMRIFGGGYAVDGRYVPLRNGAIEEVLRLPHAA